ncbi:MAG: hypothetical protein ACJ8FZ_25040, partial [Bradyrhizobium sp.]
NGSLEHAGSADQSVDTDRWRNPRERERLNFFCEFKTPKFGRVYRRHLSVRLENLCWQINDEKSFEMIEWESRGRLASRSLA